MADDTHLSLLAKQIFLGTLKKIDAGAAVRRAVGSDENGISINGEILDVSRGLYVAAIGKAAYPMAYAFDDIAGPFIKRGVVSGTPGASVIAKTNWLKFAGGHPLPNIESLESAKACCRMLEQANVEKASVVFLISGGGSAMMELPRDPSIGLSELRELNDVLVTSGASIAEINSVRRAVSAVKGGGLALKAADCEQFSLIISDTRSDDVTSVASGPSLLPDENLPVATEVIKKYALEKRIPESVLNALNCLTTESKPFIKSRVHVLLDNRAAVRHAGEIANQLGFVVKTDEIEHDETIAEGIDELLRRCLRARADVPNENVLCFISGGEFGCEVVGAGTGGRNCESVLRMALLAEENGISREFAFLSAGTDGIDGNSPAAGGVVGRNTIKTAFGKVLDAKTFLGDSNSFKFLEKLGATINTGPTGTNVRDLRIILMN
jgi:hydroxypyruvate reductase